MEKTMFDDLMEFYLTWVEMCQIVPSNRLERQRGELLAQKLLDLSDKIELELKKEITV
jgi:hypothetical protein